MKSDGPKIYPATLLSQLFSYPVPTSNLDYSDIEGMVQLQAPRMILCIYF